ncbi:MAG: hypothetical protein JXR83_21800 [Deltaproteobacteria bacterium]|nr:hypothetical protein [Deltaproteobacteria bacterium]
MATLRRVLPDFAAPGVALGVALLGLASCWQLWEQDIYWQLRAGDELLRTWRWPQVDGWSYTAAGDPWFNLQWLSTVLLRGLLAAGGEPGLAAWRGVAVALLFTALALLIRRASGSTRWPLLALVLLPLAYGAMIHRLQLRSETFVFVCFALLLWLWHGTAPLRQRVLWTWALVAISANLHAGAAPFVVVAAWLVLLSSELAPRQRLLTSAVAGALLFATPYHVKVLPFLYRHLFYFSHKVMSNPDHQPLALRHFSVSEFGWTAIVWALLAIAGWLALALLRWRRPELLPAPYRRPWLVVPVLALFSALCCNRIRSFPYLVMLVLPLLAIGLEALLDLVKQRPRPALAGLLVVASIAVTGHNWWRFPLAWGCSVSRATFPIGSVEFIRAHRPQPRLYNTFAYGNYLLWHLPDYQVFGDTREIPYWKLEATVIDAFYSAETTRALYQRYGVNVSLVPIPGTAFVPGVGFRDLISEYLPPAEWALVHFDDISVVVVRRIPEHAALIAGHEFRLLRPNLPPNHYLHGLPRSVEHDRRFGAELQRCRAAQPDDLFCLLADSAWARANQQADRYPALLAALERARDRGRVPARLRIYLQLELQGLYRALGRDGDARAIESELPR